jgi:hypothetical protein
MSVPTDDAAPRVLGMITSGHHPKVALLDKHINSGEPQPRTVMTFLPPIVVPHLPASDYVTILPILAKLQWTSLVVEHPRFMRHVDPCIAWGMACMVSAVRAGVYAFLNEVPGEYDDTWAELLTVIDHDTARHLVLNAQNTRLSCMMDQYCTKRANSPQVTTKLHTFLLKVATMGADFLRLALVAYSGKSISSSIDVGLQALRNRVHLHATAGTSKKLALFEPEIWESCLASCAGGYAFEYLREIAYDPMFSVSVTSQWDINYCTEMDKFRSEYVREEIVLPRTITEAPAPDLRPATSASSVVTFRSMDFIAPEKAGAMRALLTQETLEELRAAVELVVPAPGPPTNVVMEIEEKFTGF